MSGAQSFKGFHDIINRFQFIEVKSLVVIARSVVGGGSIFKVSDIVNDYSIVLSSLNSANAKTAWSADQSRPFEGRIEI